MMTTPRSCLFGTLKVKMYWKWNQNWHVRTGKNGQSETKSRCWIGFDDYSVHWLIGWTVYIFSFHFSQPTITANGQQCHLSCWAMCIWFVYINYHISQTSIFSLPFLFLMKLVWRLTCWACEWILLLVHSMAPFRPGLTVRAEWSDHSSTALSTGVNAPKTHWGRISELIAQTTFGGAL